VANQPGSHNFTGGYANYLLDMSPTFTLDIYFKPTFAFNVGTDQYLWGWYVDATHYLSFRYDQTTDKYLLAWKDGGTERTMLSDAYVSDVALQVWTRATFSFNLATGTAAGSEFYLDGVLISNAWSGVSDAKARYFPILNVRNLTGTAGLFTINYLRLFPSKTSTLADVTNNFNSFKDEEIIWHYNGCAMGHTRCNVTSRTRSVDIERTIESPAGNANPNNATATLLSPEGQFADDQYAPFNSSGEFYNGERPQKYMQQRCPLEIETWYSGLFELEFSGRVDENLFTRASSFQDISQVTIGAKDGVDDIKRRVRQKVYVFDSYNLSDPSAPTASLLHAIARMATQPEWYNFLANSGFENGTIGDSWLVAGAGAGISRVAGGLLGGFQCDLVYGAAACSVYQKVTFTGTKKLNVGQKWTASIYMKCAAAAWTNLYLEGFAGAGYVEGANTAHFISGGEGWRRVDITYTIADATVDTLRCTIALLTNVTLSIDCVMLVQNGQPLNWIVLNSSDGTLGVASADNAQSAVYDTVGFDVDDAMIVDPLGRVEQGESIWNYLTQIGDATAARYMGMDACGTLKYRTPFKAGYVDPASLFTITALQTIQSVINIQQPNKIVIHGVHILKDTRVTRLWSATKSSFFARDSEGYLYETVANGATWPAPASYGDFWAAYNTTPR
jgi:hypothetical protein